MSRSGYTDDNDDNWACIRWRGAVTSAMRGKRGQALLAEIVKSLDAIEDKRLAAESLVSADGEFCTLGAVGRARGMDMASIDPECREDVARAFQIPESLAAEIMYLNDEYAADEYIWVDIEICGPVRPRYPDWGKHTVSVLQHNNKAAEQRWQYMRDWAVKNLAAT